MSLLDLVDSLAKVPHCLLDGVILADLSIFLEQDHLLNRFKKRRVDLNLDLQEILISNQFRSKSSSDIRVRPLQSLDESIGPNHLKFRIPDHELNPAGELNGSDADLAFGEDIDLDIVAIDLEVL